MSITKQLLNDNKVSVQASGPHGLGPVASWRKRAGVCVCARAGNLNDLWQLPFRWGVHDTEVVLSISIPLISS